MTVIKWAEKLGNLGALWAGDKQKHTGKDCLEHLHPQSWMWQPALPLPNWAYCKVGDLNQYFIWPVQGKQETQSLGFGSWYTPPLLLHQYSDAEKEEALEAFSDTVPRNWPPSKIRRIFVLEEVQHNKIDQTLTANREIWPCPQLKRVSSVNRAEGNENETSASSAVMGSWWKWA